MGVEDNPWAAPMGKPTSAKYRQMWGTMGIRSNLVGGGGVFDNLEEEAEGVLGAGLGVNEEDGGSP